MCKYYICLDKIQETSLNNFVRNLFLKWHEYYSVAFNDNNYFFEIIDFFSKFIWLHYYRFSFCKKMYSALVCIEIINKLKKARNQVD